MKRIKGLADVIIVKVDNIFNDRVTVDENKDIRLDTDIDKARNMKMWGEVVQIPSIMTNEIILMASDIYVQKPQSEEYVQEIDYKTYKDLPTPAQVGDKIWFHWNVLLNEDNHLQGDYYKVPYEMVICADKYYESYKGRIFRINPFTDERLERIKDEPWDDNDLFFEQNKRNFCRSRKMANAFVLCIPDQESWDDIKIPIPEVKDGKVVMKKGKPVMKPESEWMLAKSAPDNKVALAYVVKSGDPIKGHPELGLENGDHIMYYHKGNWQVMMDDEAYFLIRQRHVQGIVNSVHK